MKKLLIAGALVVAIASGAALYAQQNPWMIYRAVDLASSLPGRIEKIIPGHKKKATAAPMTILNCPPAKMREVLAASYRLKPDNRFMLAVADIAHFFTGRPKMAAQARFENGHWVISYDGKLVGTLPELPDFYDFTSVLSFWTQSLNEEYPLRLSSSPEKPILGKLASKLPRWVPFIKKKSRPELSDSEAKADMAAINNDLAQFMAPNLMDAGRRINRLWNGGWRDPALLNSATQTLVFLYLQSMDKLEIGDALPAKALAMLAITKTLTGRECRDEEALLSFSMGYSNYAVYAARKLPQSDPVSAYIDQDGQRLAQLASAPNSSTESRYLLLINVSHKAYETGNVAPFIKCLQTYFTYSWITLPVFKAGVDMGTFSLTPDMAQTMPSMVLMAMEQDEGTAPDMNDLLKKEMTRPDNQFGFLMETFFGDIQSKFPVIIKNFRSGLDRLGSKYSGPFLGPQTYRAYYKGYFYSGIYKLGLHYLDMLNSTNAAAQLAGELGAAKHGTAADFRTWYTALVRSQQGKSSLATLSTLIDNCKHMGAAPFMRTFHEQTKYYRLADPALLTGVKDMVAHLDTRIADRQFLLNQAYERLYDLPLAEKMALSILAAAGQTNRYLQLWYAGLNRNMHQVTAIMNSAGENTKIEALGFLQKQKNADAELINSQYRNIIQGDPDNWQASWGYAKYLKKQKRYPEAIGVLRNWLRRRVKTYSLNRLVAHARIAKLYYDKRQYRGGWKEIAPYIQSGYGGAMTIGAKLLDKLGRHDGAEKLARALLNTYPDYLRSRLPLVELYWRHDKYDQAANLLKAAVYPIINSSWRTEIGPAFVNIFKNRPKEAMAAYEALISKGFDPGDPAEIGWAFYDVKNYKMAFNMVSRVKVGNPLENLQYLIYDYGCLKKYKTEEEALAWLRSQIPPQMVNPASLMAYDSGNYELLWDFNPVSGNQEQVEWFWIFRAAASLIKPVTSQQRQELVNYFSENQKGDCVIGRYLMGLAPEQDVFGDMKTTADRCGNVYYLGLKAWKEGRYADATDWFRVSLEIGRWQTPEYRWAYSTLSDWLGKHESLELLAKDKV